MNDPPQMVRRSTWKNTKMNWQNFLKDKMNKTYIVEDSFFINNHHHLAQVLVLDHARELNITGSLEFEFDGGKVPYQLTHNDYWIVVQDNLNYKGKHIVIN